MILKKIISFAVSVTVLISFVFRETLIAVPAVQSARYDISGNSNFPLLQNGKVVNCNIVEGSDLVINIQDAHCNAGVQKTIAAVLKEIDEQLHIDKIYVEGAFNKIDPAWLLTETGGKTIAARAIESGAVTGAEYYCAQNGMPDKLYGIEDKALYLENFSLLLEMYSFKNRLNAAADIIESKINASKELYFSPKNKNLAKIIKKHDEGKIDFKKYSKLLQKKVLSVRKEDSYKNISFKDKYYDEGSLSRIDEIFGNHSRVNYKKLQAEITFVLSEIKDKYSYGRYASIANERDADKILHKILLNNPADLEKYGEIQKYLNHKRLVEGFDGQAMLKEEKKLIRELMAMKSQSRAELEVVFISDFLSYLKGLLNNSLPSYEYEYFCEYFPLFNSLLAKYCGNEELLAVMPEIGKIRSFFDNNIKRNEVFVKNLAAKKKAESGKRKVIVCVTGGFHSEGLAALYKEKNVSFVTVMPKIAEFKESSKIYDGLALAQKDFITNMYGLPVASANLLIKTLVVLDCALASAAEHQDFKQLNGNVTAAAPQIINFLNASKADFGIASLGYEQETGYVVVSLKETDIKFDVSSGKAEMPSKTDDTALILSKEFGASGVFELNMELYHLEKLMQAIKERKLLAVSFPNKKDGEFYFDYYTRVESVIASFAGDIFVKLYPESSKSNFGFSLKESLKNAFVHGNKLEADNRVYIFIDAKKEEFQCVGIEKEYNADKEMMDLAEKAGLHGLHGAVKLMRWRGVYSSFAEQLSNGAQIYRTVYKEASSEKKALYGDDYFKNLPGVKPVSFYDQTGKNRENAAVIAAKTNKSGVKDIVLDGLFFAKTIQEKRKAVLELKEDIEDALKNNLLMAVTVKSTFDNNIKNSLPLNSLYIKSIGVISNFADIIAQSDAEFNQDLYVRNFTFPVLDLPGMNFAIIEMMCNAVQYGNKGILNRPLYIDIDAGKKKVTVINIDHEKKEWHTIYIQNSALMNGNKVGTQYIKNAYGGKYSGGYEDAGNEIIYAASADFSDNANSLTEDAVVTDLGASGIVEIALDDFDRYEEQIHDKLSGAVINGQVIALTVNGGFNASMKDTAKLKAVFNNAFEAVKLIAARISTDVFFDEGNGKVNQKYIDPFENDISRAVRELVLNAVVHSNGADLKKKVYLYVDKNNLAVSVITNQDNAGGSGYLKEQSRGILHGKGIGIQKLTETYKGQYAATEQTLPSKIKLRKDFVMFPKGQSGAPAASPVSQIIFPDDENSTLKILVKELGVSGSMDINLDNYFLIGLSESGQREDMSGYPAFGRFNAKNIKNEENLKKLVELFDDVQYALDKKLLIELTVNSGFDEKQYSENQLKAYFNEKVMSALMFFSDLLYFNNEKSDNYVIVYELLRNALAHGNRSDLKRKIYVLFDKDKRRLDVINLVENDSDDYLYEVSRGIVHGHSLGITEISAMGGNYFAAKEMLQNGKVIYRASVAMPDENGVYADIPKSLPNSEMVDVMEDIRYSGAFLSLLYPFKGYFKGVFGKAINILSRPLTVAPALEAFVLLGLYSVAGIWWASAVFASVHIITIWAAKALDIKDKSGTGFVKAAASVFKNSFLRENIKNTVKTAGFLFVGTLFIAAPFSMPLIFAFPWQIIIVLLLNFALHLDINFMSWLSEGRLPYLSAFSPMAERNLYNIYGAGGELLEEQVAGTKTPSALKMFADEVEFRGVVPDTGVARMNREDVMLFNYCGKQISFICSGGTVKELVIYGDDGQVLERRKRFPYLNAKKNSDRVWVITEISKEAMNEYKKTGLPSKFEVHNLTDNIKETFYGFGFKEKYYSDYFLRCLNYSKQYSVKGIVPEGQRNIKLLSSNRIFPKSRHYGKIFDVEIFNNKIVKMTVKNEGGKLLEERISTELVNEKGNLIKEWITVYISREGWGKPKLPQYHDVKIKNYQDEEITGFLYADGELPAEYLNFLSGQFGALKICGHKVSDEGAAVFNSKVLFMSEYAGFELVYTYEKNKGVTAVDILNSKGEVLETLKAGENGNFNGKEVRKKRWYTVFNGAWSDGKYHRFLDTAFMDRHQVLEVIKNNANVSIDGFATNVQGTFKYNLPISKGDTDNILRIFFTLSAFKNTPLRVFYENGKIAFIILHNENGEPLCTIYNYKYDEKGNEFAARIAHYTQAGKDTHNENVSRELTKITLTDNNTGKEYDIYNNALSDILKYYIEKFKDVTITGISADSEREPFNRKNIKFSKLYQNVHTEIVLRNGKLHHATAIDNETGKELETVDFDNGRIMQLSLLYPLRDMFTVSAARIIINFLSEPMLVAPIWETGLVMAMFAAAGFAPAAAAFAFAHIVIAWLGNAAKIKKDSGISFKEASKVFLKESFSKENIKKNIINLLILAAGSAAIALPFVIPSFCGVIATDMALMSFGLHMLINVFAGLLGFNPLSVFGGTGVLAKKEAAEKRKQNGARVLFSVNGIEYTADIVFSFPEYWHEKNSTFNIENVTAVNTGIKGSSATYRKEALNALFWEMKNNPVIRNRVYEEAGLKAGSLAAFAGLKTVKNEALARKTALSVSAADGNAQFARHVAGIMKESGIRNIILRDLPQGLSQNQNEMVAQFQNLGINVISGLPYSGMIRIKGAFDSLKSLKISKANSFEIYFEKGVYFDAETASKLMLKVSEAFEPESDDIYVNTLNLNFSLSENLENDFIRAAGQIFRDYKLLYDFNGLYSRLDREAPELAGIFKHCGALPGSRGVNENRKQFIRAVSEKILLKRFLDKAGKNGMFLQDGEKELLGALLFEMDIEKYLERQQNENIMLMIRELMPAAAKVSKWIKLPPSQIDEFIKILSKYDDREYRSALLEVLQFKAYNKIEIKSVTVNKQTPAFTSSILKAA